MSQASKFAALALAGAVTIGTVAGASAAPVTAGAAGLKAVATTPVENVQYRRGFGPGPFVAGAILGGAVAGIATGGFGYGYGPGYYPVYGGYYPAYAYPRAYYRPYYRPYAYYGYGPGFWGGYSYGGGRRAFYGGRRW